MHSSSIIEAETGPVSFVSDNISVSKLSVCIGMCDSGRFDLVCGQMTYNSPPRCLYISAVKCLLPGPYPGCYALPSMRIRTTVFTQPARVMRLFPYLRVIMHFHLNACVVN